MPIPHTVPIPYVAPISQRVPILSSGATLALRRKFRTQVPTPPPCASRLERTQVQVPHTGAPSTTQVQSAACWSMADPAGLVQPVRWSGCRGCNGDWALRPSGALRHLQVPHTAFKTLESDGVSECREWRTTCTVEAKALATEFGRAVPSPVRRRGMI